MSTDEGDLDANDACANRRKLVVASDFSSGINKTTAVIGVGHVARIGLGDVVALGVMRAEQGTRQASIGVAQAKANRLADTVALFQALGGGW